MNPVRFCLFAAAVTGVTLVAAPRAGYRLNTTTSMPVGIWHLAALPSYPARGTAVLFCMSDESLAAMALRRGYVGRGECPAGVEPLLKFVAAVPGDNVSVSSSGISLNGAAIPGTAPLAYDSAGRALPALPEGEYLVSPGKVWLVAPDNPRSFDSRYFGSVNQVDIMGIATPVLTWH